MRYSAKRKQDISVSKAPIETVIPLLEPVRIYTAIELAAMPLSRMNEAIAAQEAYYLIEHTTQMGGASYCCAPLDARGCAFNSGQRKIKNTLQDQQRICRTSNNSSVGKAWIGEIEWGKV
ncbi:hypothetical protein [Acinetobacter bereziniae]|nr:hypothetical protein [Acinetobacter bereziniae]